MEKSLIVPKIGETRSGWAIGKTWQKPVVWFECPKCKKCRWIQVQTTKDENFTGFCDKCYRKNRSHFGKRKKTQARFQLKSGYVYIRVYPEDFFYSMAGNNGYISEHRLVMAKHLKRNLHRWEIIHHKNGDKGDNRIENLQLVTDDRHRQITVLETRIKFLEGRLDKAGISYNCTK